MVATTRYNLSGLKEMQAAFLELTGEVQLRLARRATSEGAAIVRDSIKETALKRDKKTNKPYTHKGVTYQVGELSRQTKIANIRDTDLTSEHIVFVVSNKRNGYIGRIANLNEWGTVKMAPQPFFRQGFAQSSAEASDKIGEVLARGITNSLKGKL